MARPLDELMALDPERLLKEIGEGIGRGLTLHEELGIAVLALVYKAGSSGIFVLGRGRSELVTLPRYLAALGYPLNGSGTHVHDGGVYECKVRGI